MQVVPQGAAVHSGSECWSELDWDCETPVFSGMLASGVGVSLRPGGQLLC